MLYPVDWDGDWPVINGCLPSQEVNLTKYPEHTKTLSEQNLSSFEDSFADGRLSPEWISLRNSLKDRLSVKTNNLSLTGSDLTLSDLGTPSFLGIRQTEQDEAFEVELNPEQCSLKDGQLGIAVTIDSDHFASLTVQKNDHDTFDLIKTVHVLDLVVEDKIAEINTLPSKFSLINHPATKEFVAEVNDQKSSFKVAAMHLSNEAISALNTGDMQGLYVVDQDTRMSVNNVKRFKINQEK